MKNRSAFLLTTLLVPTLLWAKAYYAPMTEMIQKSDVIAIVNVTRVEPIQAQGGTWTYQEKAIATIENVIKGKIPNDLELHGGENFICAQVHFQPGRQLVFLKRDGQILAGSNWHLSVRPIKNEKVEWYQHDTGLALIEKPLPAVLQEIQKELETPRP